MEKESTIESTHDAVKERREEMGEEEAEADERVGVCPEETEKELSQYEAEIVRLREMEHIKHKMVVERGGGEETGEAGREEAEEGREDSGEEMESKERREEEEKMEEKKREKQCKFLQIGIPSSYTVTISFPSASNKGQKESKTFHFSSLWPTKKCLEMIQAEAPALASFSLYFSLPISPSPSPSTAPPPKTYIPFPFPFPFLFPFSLLLPFPVSDSEYQFHLSPHLTSPFLLYFLLQVDHYDDATSVDCSDTDLKLIHRAWGGLVAIERQRWR